MKSRLTLCVAGLCLLLLMQVSAIQDMRAQSSAPVVYGIRIEGTIDLGLAPFLLRCRGIRCLDSEEQRV
jgi:membrane-bound ClpP family serine protease